ncbi:hypothetical protein [Flavobacterium suncheonense]|uniref:Uncharacterized protein n=1 Tax=Flavobacterium suncheonense GH29-5 = DSM 17707 TaxID=1121899 RepID=A0A0A2MBU9_9FLAO|nr:hypothetical protein [Flavobacterium suncheonense]KGO89724.1 hypothetical protein Q764_05885 [Flavobacterium suncheonense GH29-5 = DSM 17707]
MYKFLILVLVSCFFEQSYYCLEEGVEEIISNNIETKPLKYKSLRYNKKQVYFVDSTIKLTLSNKDSFFKFSKNNKKISIAQKTKDKSNIFLNLV